MHSDPWTTQASATYSLLEPSAAEALSCETLVPSLLVIDTMRKITRTKRQSDPLLRH